MVRLAICILMASTSIAAALGTNGWTDEVWPVQGHIAYTNVADFESVTVLLKKITALWSRQNVGAPAASTMPAITAQEIRENLSPTNTFYNYSSAVNDQDLEYLSARTNGDDFAWTNIWYDGNAGIVYPEEFTTNNPAGWDWESDNTPLVFDKVITNIVAGVTNSFTNRTTMISLTSETETNAIAMNMSNVRILDCYEALRERFEARGAALQWDAVMFNQPSAATTEIKNKIFACIGTYINTSRSNDDLEDDLNTNGNFSSFSLWTTSSLATSVGAPSNWFILPDPKFNQSGTGPGIGRVITNQWTIPSDTTGQTYEVSDYSGGSHSISGTNGEVITAVVTNQNIEEGFTHNAYGMIYTKDIINALVKMRIATVGSSLNMVRTQEGDSPFLVGGGGTGAENVAIAVATATVDYVESMIVTSTANVIAHSFIYTRLLQRDDPPAAGQAKIRARTVAPRYTIPYTNGRSLHDIFVQFEKSDDFDGIVISNVFNSQTYALASTSWVFHSSTVVTGGIAEIEEIGTLIVPANFLTPTNESGNANQMGWQSTRPLRGVSTFNVLNGFKYQ